MLKTFTRLPLDRYLNFLVIFALGGLSLCLTLGHGPYKVFIGLVELSFLLLLMQHIYLHRSVPQSLLYLLLVPAVFLLCHSLASEAVVDKNARRNIFAYLAIAGVFLLAKELFAFHRKIKPRQLVLLLACIPAASQFTALVVLGLESGFFDNPHYLTLLNVTLVNLGCYFIYAYSTLERYLGIFLVSAAFVMLLILPSAVGFLALNLAFLCIMLCLIFFRSRGRRMIYLGVFLCALIALASVLFLSFERSSEETLNNLVRSGDYLIKDERSILWLDSWRMQLAAAPRQWLFGHGLGGFEADFPAYTRFHDTIDFVFPHNFLLEVLYNSGVFGLLALLCSLALLITRLYLACNNSAEPLALLALGILTTVFAYTFLTLPLLSKYAAYMLGFSVGFSGWLCRWKVSHAVR